MLPSLNPKTGTTSPARSDLNCFFNTLHPLDPPQCLVSPEHEILKFLYFKRGNSLIDHGVSLNTTPPPLGPPP